MATELLPAVPGGEVIVYESLDGEGRDDVRFDQKSVWLTERQMAEVFQTSTDNVSLHLRNVYATGELEVATSVEDFSVVRSEGQRQVRHYNPAAIISIGYRVNSKRAVRFRQWATRTLREHLVIGNPRGDALEAILGNVEQTMFGESLYRSREEKAAKLLYFAVKDHPFTTGNKRGGALLFLLYMTQEGIEFRPDPGALTALTLLIAESEPSNKYLMFRLIVNLIGEFGH